MGIYRSSRVLIFFDDPPERNEDQDKDLKAGRRSASLKNWVWSVVS